ncbi:MAG: outer membrane protein transport protein [Gammaproteobacteria bacterium]|nr:outer membrane protein transport protein [Gammaproteobacteria bacterium]MCW8922665.1 outer membrane protein transport protein [Gammaproteobacteria bacterium]
MKNALIFWLSGVLLLTFPLSGFAFDNGPTWFGFNHTPNVSGARTIGMGGTAVASVNDASASLTNPAALVRLSKTEFRVDGNFRHIEGLNKPGADNLGTGKSIRMGLRVDETNQIDPALMALATPIGNGRTVIGLFHHEFLPYDRYVTVTDPISGNRTETHNVMFDLDEFGFSVAHSLFDGRLAIGLSASMVTPNMLITVKQDQTPQPGSFDRIEFASYGSQTEQEPIWRFGLLYRPTETMAFGANYTLTQNTEYTMTTANSPATINSAQQNGCMGDVNIGVLADGTPTGNWICPSSLQLPVSLSIGFAYTPNEAWTFAIEATRIDYSYIEEFHAPYAYPGGDITVIQSNSDFKARDVVELHLGLEYRTRFKQQPLALRAGYYLDPAHDIKYYGTDSTSQLIYPNRKDVQHLTAGVGMLFSEALQFDLALDAADDDSYRVAISFAYQY